MRACTSVTPYIYPSREDLCHLPAADSSLCHLLLCPSPSFLVMSGTCQVQNLHPKLPPQTGRWPAGRQEHTQAAQPPPAVLCSRTAGPVPAMPGSDRSRADPAHAGPARGWPCPLHARVTLRCLMGSGCLQEPLIPMRGENSNKRLKLSLSCLGKSSPRWECQNLWKIGAGQE